MSTPTAAQIEALLNYLEEHRDLARGNLRSAQGRVQSHQLWENICATLNAMGGCTKSTKQWQKVWTDKKYLAKKAAVAARRSAATTGGGPSTAPSLSQMELKVISIMGEGFGEPQTSARVPAFVAHETPGTSTEDDDLPIVQLNDPLPEETQNTEPGTQPSQMTPARNESHTHNTMTPRRQQRRVWQRSALLQTSVRDRLFQLEEQRNAEFAGIRTAIVELCRLVQLFIERQ